MGTGPDRKGGVKQNGSRHPVMIPAMQRPGNALGRESDSRIAAAQTGAYVECVIQESLIFGAVLFSPVFGPVQCVGANHLSANRADHVRTQSLSHPCVGMFIGNRIGRFDSKTACWCESVA